MIRALPLRSLSSLLFWSLLVPALLVAAPPSPVELRDITVAQSGSRATVTFLVTDEVTTIVVEPGKNGLAEIRMKPMKAGSTALESATLRPGVRSIRAFIERKDVLVTRVTFARAVLSMKVIGRSDEKIVVEVELGAALKGSSKPTASKPPPSKPTSRPKTSSTSKPKAKPKSGAAARPKSTGGKKPTASASKKARSALTTIVIDAGHGGKDPGAIGLDDLREKDVTLSVARRLRDELKTRLPGVKIIMTRDGDQFIALDRRGEIANRRGGRLFISIHCNSMPEKPHPVSGFECYVLRPGTGTETAGVAGAENRSAHYESGTAKYKANGSDGTAVAGISRNAFGRYSERAARQIGRELRVGTALVDRGIHQAGFIVLIGAAMPAVLIEIGYLSSEEDIKLLKSSTGRARIARAIAKGIVAYEKELKK